MDGAYNYLRMSNRHLVDFIQSDWIELKVEMEQPFDLPTQESQAENLQKMELPKSAYDKLKLQ
jgi:hypothetical protein